MLVILICKHFFRKTIIINKLFSYFLTCRLFMVVGIVKGWVFLPHPKLFCMVWPHSVSNFSETTGTFLARKLMWITSCSSDTWRKQREREIYYGRFLLKKIITLQSFTLQNSKFRQIRLWLWELYAHLLTTRIILQMEMFRARWPPLQLLFRGIFNFSQESSFGVICHWTSSRKRDFTFE